MKIVDSDAFLDMPLSTQSLYFHLGMRADDDGFVNSPKRIARLVGAGEDDLKLLIAKRFILAFENGVVVIKHWKMQNTLKNDRVKAPQYPELAALIYIKPNGAYSVDEITGVSLLDSKRIPNGIPREGKGNELNGIELNGSEGEGTGLPDASPTSKLEKMGGALGQGVLMLTDEQTDDLLDKLSIDEYNLYCKKLSDYIIAHPEKTFKSHYQTILKWVTEDRKRV
jgi:hypothetical protein